MKKAFWALTLWFITSAAGAAGKDFYFLGVQDRYWFELTGSWVASDITMKVLPQDLKPLGPTAIFTGDFIFETIHNPPHTRYLTDLGLDALGCGLGYIFNIKW